MVGYIDLNKYNDIYVFSNVPYNQKNILDIQGNSLALFINKAYNIDKYTNCDKLLIRRHDAPCFGTSRNNCINIVMFDKSTRIVSLDTLNDCFDKQIFMIIGEKLKFAKPLGGFTTGYNIVKYIQLKYPKIKLHLVNFGCCLKDKYKLISAHNWSWQDEQLKHIHHIYLD